MSLLKWTLPLLASVWAVAQTDLGAPTIVCRGEIEDALRNLPAEADLDYRDSLRRVTSVLDSLRAAKKTDGMDCALWTAPPAAVPVWREDQAVLQARSDRGEWQATAELGYRLSEARADSQAFELFSVLADQGYALGQVSVGRAYLYGWGVTQDSAQGLAYVSKALPSLNWQAERGHALAQNALGRIYENGEGVPSEPTQASQWYQKAAQQGYARAQFHLGSLYEQGKGLKKDLAMAVQWYMKAAEQGKPYAQYAIASHYLFGEGVKKDLAKAFLWFKKAAEQGVSHAQYNLGVLYANGDGVKKNISLAISWYQKAAAQGDPDALNNLGALYDRGVGVKKDPRLAVQWYQKAAALGQSNAQRNLGIIYLTGEGIDADTAEALRWFLAAAQQGQAQALHSVGAFYYLGLGTPVDKARAYYYFRQEAYAGSWDGANGLAAIVENEYPSVAREVMGLCAQQGSSQCQRNRIQYAQRDEEADLALAWARVLAENTENPGEQAYAQLLLGGRYSYGMSMDDARQAELWWAKSAKNGDTQAKYYLSLFQRAQQGDRQAGPELRDSLRARGDIPWAQDLKLRIESKPLPLKKFLARMEELLAECEYCQEYAQEPEDLRQSRLYP